MMGKEAVRRVKGRGTYPDYISELHQPWQFLALGAAAPELAGGVIGGDINGTEGQLVGLEDRLQAGSSGDDVGGPRRQGGIQVERRVGHGVDGDQIQGLGW